MAEPGEISSEQELLELLNEGKISQDEYDDLLAAVRRPAPGVLEGPAKVRRKRVLWIGLAAIVAVAASLIAAAVIARSRRIDLVIIRDSLRIRPYSEGGLHCLSLSIRNTGNADSDEFRFYFYRGDPGDSSPANHGAGPIKAGGVWNASSRPYQLKEGVNDFVIVLDPHNTVKESDETNNQAWLKVVVSQNKVVKKVASYSGGKTEEGHK